MATTYEWSFPNFETDADNKVKTIHWRYTAVDGEYSATMYGSDGQTSDQNFDTITKDDAIACVLEHSDTTEADMKANLDAQIASQKAPTLTSKTKEW
ncbi:hypothetical protein Kolga_gp22 [Pelagibacter phage Kolga EXVC016S]|nr:hypothetical protein Kolga_gp22 [Pelagibacter phage Kolga EXVC016S]